MFKYWGYTLNMMQYYKKKATFARNITKNHNNKKTTIITSNKNK